MGTTGESRQETFEEVVIRNERRRLSREGEDVFFADDVLRKMKEQCKDPESVKFPVELRNPGNYKEWLCYWNDHVDSLARTIDPIFKHYVEGKVSDIHADESLLSRYGKESATKMDELMMAIKSYFGLVFLANRSPELYMWEVYALDPHKIYIPRVMHFLEESNDPIELKLAELRSYQKRVLESGKLEDHLLHERFYGTDYLIVGLAKSVDTPQLRDEVLIAILKRLERIVRVEFDEAAVEGQSLSEMQMRIILGLKDKLFPEIHRSGAEEANHIGELEQANHIGELEQVEPTSEHEQDEPVRELEQAESKKEPDQREPRRDLEQAEARREPEHTQFRRGPKQHGFRREQRHYYRRNQRYNRKNNRSFHERY